METKKDLSTGFNKKPFERPQVTLVASMTEYVICTSGGTDGPTPDGPASAPEVKSNGIQPLQNDASYRMNF